MQRCNKIYEGKLSSSDMMGKEKHVAAVLHFFCGQLQKKNGILIV
jgi:hypothetical protein